MGKCFGPHWALRDVSFRLERGQALCLFGPNGSGKTTLLRILARLLRPSAGEVRVEGAPLGSLGDGSRREAGFLTHASFLYPALSPRENLLFHARLFRLERPAERAEKVLGELGLAGRMHDPVRVLSQGLQRRVAIARALLHRPSLLLLDEPFAGLDQGAADGLVDLLKRHRREGRTLILTTHDFGRALALADRLGILRAGRLVDWREAEGMEVEALAASYREHTAR
ncbi:MAG: heme ABC exporter ATP-binding protein CcmA [Nitrospinota bacterium]